MTDLVIEPGAKRVRMGTGEAEPTATSDESRAAGMKRQNWALNFSSNTFSSIDFPVDEEYSPFEDDKDLFLGPDALPPNAFVDSVSAQETRLIAHQVRQEQKALDVISQNNAGAWGEVFGAITAPHVALGAVVPPAWGVGALVGVEVAAEIASEGFLHSQQHLRTIPETVLNVVAVAGGVAVLGAATKVLDDPAAYFKPKSVPPEQQPLETILMGGKAAKPVEDVSAQMADDTMAGGPVAEALSIGPMSRLMKSTSSEARVLGQKLVDSPFLTRGGEKGKTHGVPVEARTEAATGRTIAAIDQAKPMQKKSGLSPEAFDIEVGRAMTQGDIHPNPHVEAAARHYRAKVVEPLKADAVAAKMMNENVVAKYAKSYFPRVYVAEAIQKNWVRLKYQLGETIRREQPDVPVEDIDQLVLLKMESMMGAGPVRSVSGQAKPSALHSRTVALMDDELELYVDRRASAVLLRHTQGMAPYLELRKALGNVDLAGQLAKVREQYRQAIDVAPAKGKAALIKQLASDLKDIERVRQRVLNQVQRAADPQSPIIKTIQVSKTLNLATQLGGVVLSSTPDLARPLMMYGLRSYAKGVAATVGQVLTRDGGHTKAAVQRLGAALERTRNQRLLDMADANEPTSQLIAQTNRLWGKVTLFNAWTDAVETLAAHSAMDWTLRMARRVADGKKISRADRGALSRMGLNSETLTAIHREVSEFPADSTLLKADTLQWQNYELARTFEAAIGSDVHRAIVRVGHGDKPLFMDETVWSWIFQYMSFAMASTNRMLVAGLQQRDMKLAVGLLSGMALGAGVGASKAWLRGDDPGDWDASQWLAEGVDRSGMLGIYNPAMNVVRYAAAEAGYGEMPSRYLHRGAESVLLGPTISNVGRAARFGTSVVEGEPKWEQAARLTPFLSNGLHFRQVMQQLSE